MGSFRDLRVWQESIDLIVEIYEAARLFPRYEQFGLTAQMERAAISISSNIAEGQGRITRGEWQQFLGNARGSLYELETQLIIANRLGFLSAERFAKLAARASAIGRGLGGLIDYAEHAPRRRPQRTTDNGQRTT